MKVAQIDKLAGRRTLLLKKNIAFSFLFKGASVFINFLLVPLLITYLNTEKYGIWLLLTSVTAWAGFCDFGLGNGLKNRLSEALANNDLKSAKTYISTTYAYVVLIVLGIFAIYGIGESFINWNVFVNSDIIPLKELRLIALVVFGFFLIRFALNQLIFVVAAKQYSAINDLINFLINLISLGCLFVLMSFGESSLLKLSIIFSAIPIMIILIASLVLYRGPFKAIRPSIKEVNFKSGKSLMNLGFKFFIIQIAGIVMFSTDNVIIANLLGPQEVSVYNIAFKYFGIITLGFSIICAPFWPAYTEAFYRDDINWIKGITKKLVRIWILFLCATISLVLVSPVLYELWIGDTVDIPFFLSLSMALFVILSSWASIFTTFVNGVGKVRLQLIFSLIVAVFNIPLSIFFVKTLGLGSSGVILATSVCLSYGPLLSYIQYKKL